MKNSIWTVVALGTGAAFVPLVLDVNVADGSTSDTILGLLSAVGPLVGIAFFVSVFGLLITLFMGGGSDF
jgi:hypothetical protein